MKARLPRVMLLVLGTLLLVGSQLRFGLPLLAWFLPLPWLAWLRGATGWRSRLVFVGFFVLAWHLAIAKIVTPPLRYLFVPGFAVPIGLVHAAPYLAWASFRSRVPEWLGSLGFAAGIVLAEWLLHAALPFGTWGALANTQLDHLALLQLASVTGLYGVSFLMAWLAASCETCWAAIAARDEPRLGPALRHAGLALVTVLGVVLLGELRLARAVPEAPTVTLAGIGTDASFSGLPLPSAEELERIDTALTKRTRIAARAGARVVVWTEAATLVRPEDEAAWLTRTEELARSERIHLVAAYVVPLKLEPLLYQNKYLLISPEGHVLHSYSKHRPVPGEPAVRGEGPAPVAIVPDVGRVSGAICYDYDFPRLALGHAAAQVDLVVLPASDWRGIHPLHTQMAGLRAIEIGASVLRATRHGLSAGFDPHGRMRGAVSHVDSGEGILLVELPQHRVSTLYGALGDWFVAVSALLWLGLWVRRLSKASS